jgi:hypothetical protein
MRAGTVELLVKVAGVCLRHLQETKQQETAQESQTRYSEAPNAGQMIRPASKVDPNALLGMALLHMRNMTNITTRPR